MSKRTSINEILGKKGKEAQAAGLDFHDLKELLGENMPKLEFHALGRVRLIRALQNRFGQNYRAVTGIKELLDKFDREAHAELQHHILKKRLSKLGE